MADLRNIIENVFSTKNIVIIGDLVADQFLGGTIQRVSREAPVFIMRHDETETLPGAAANAAANVASLGGKPILIGTIGNDANGEHLAVALHKNGVDTSTLLESCDGKTTTKIRVLAGQQFAAKNQVIRIDYEPTTPNDEKTQNNLREQLNTAASNADAIIVSDYNYGAVFPDIYADALAIAKERGIPIVVDSRFRLADYHGATSATPNSDEAEQLLGHGFSDDDCGKLCERLELKALLVTNGNKGMSLYEREGSPTKIAAVGSPVAVDVTGAGDTVIAAYALGLASGLSFAEAAHVANHAGGIVVMKKRTATVSGSELLASVGSHADLASGKS